MDGLALITPKRVWHEHPFDEETFRRFHLYDLDFSMQVAQHYTNYVCHTIDVLHLSGGSYTQEWFIESKKFITKWKEKLPFYVLPYSKHFIRRCEDYDAYKAIKLHLVYDPQRSDLSYILRQIGQVKTFPYKFRLIRYIWQALKKRRK